MADTATFAPVLKTTYPSGGVRDNLPSGSRRKKRRFPDHGKRAKRRVKPPRDLGEAAANTSGGAPF